MVREDTRVYHLTRPEQYTVWVAMDTFNDDTSTRGGGGRLSDVPLIFE